jgi:integrase
MQPVLFDAAGHRRSPVTMPGFQEGRAPRNKGRQYPADPPTVEEIIAVIRESGGGADGARLRALIVILWRAGVRIGEALDLAETDLDASRGAVLVRRGKGWPSSGGRNGSVGLDATAAVARGSASATAGHVVVCDPRRDRRPTLGAIVGPQAAGAHRSPGWCAAAVRAASAASCARD